jgi:uncharacterized protein
MDEEQASSWLIQAAYDCNLDGVAELLEAGARTSATDRNGFTALHWRAFRGLCSPDTPHIAELLVRGGADPNARTNAGDTVLIWAVESGNATLVRTLIKLGADPNQRSNGVTPLMCAAACGDAGVVGELLEGGADRDATEGRFRARDYALHNGHDHITAMLETAPN